MRFAAPFALDTVPAASRHAAVGNALTDRTPPHAVEDGEIFAGFRIVRLLGSGGMGEVYLVQHPRLPRRDALKLLPPDWSIDQEYRTRFKREAGMPVDEVVRIVTAVAAHSTMPTDKGCCTATSNRPTSC